MNIKKHPKYALLVSDTGKVYYSKNRKEVNKRVDKDGYLRITFWNPEERKTKCKGIHRLVVQTHLPNPEHLPVVNHIDGDKLNNNLSNLEWCTVGHNVRHAYKLGLIKPNKCEESHHTSLSNKEVELICKDIEGGLRNVDIRKKYGISKGALDHIRYGDTWKEIKANFNLTVSRKGSLSKETVFWILSQLELKRTAKQILESSNNSCLSLSNIYNISCGRLYPYWVEEYKNKSSETSRKT